MTRTAKEQLERTFLAGVYDAAPTTMAFGPGSVRAGPFAVGEYELQCSVDCFFLQGDNTVVATTSSNPLRADKPKRFEVTGPENAHVATIQAAAPGMMFITNPRGPTT